MDGPPPPDAWAKMADDGARHIQDTARWLLGVVAASLLAAAQLSGFGRLEPDNWRFWLAAVAAVATVLSVGWIIKVVLDVQGGLATLDLDKLTDDQWRYVHESGFMKDYQTYADFAERQRALLDQYIQLRDLQRPPLLVPREIAGDVVFPDIREQLVAMKWEEYNVSVLLGWYTANRRFRRMRMVMIAGGIFAAVAILVLVWAANPPVAAPTMPNR